MDTRLDCLRALFRKAPFMVDVGVAPVHAAEGQVHTVLPLAPRHLQHTGQVHAGVMVSMADHTMGIAAQTLAAAGFMVITAELSTSLLRAAGGERLFCEARVIKAGRSISFTEADVYCESAGRPRVHVARASATMALTRQPLAS